MGTHGFVGEDFLVFVPHLCYQLFIEAEVFIVLCSGFGCSLGEMVDN